MLILNQEIRDGLSAGNLSEYFIGKIINEATNLEVVKVVARNAKLFRDSGVEVYDISDIAIRGHDPEVIEATAKKAGELIGFGFSSDFIMKIASSAKNCRVISALASNHNYFAEVDISNAELLEIYILARDDKLIEKLGGNLKKLQNAGLAPVTLCNLAIYGNEPIITALIEKEDLFKLPWHIFGNKSKISIKYFEYILYNAASEEVVTEILGNLKLLKSRFKFDDGWVASVACQANNAEVVARLAEARHKVTALKLLPYQIAAIIEFSRDKAEFDEAIKEIKKEKSFDIYYERKSREYYTIKCGTAGNNREEIIREHK